MVKKFTSIIISFALIAGLTACGEKVKKQVSINIKLPPISMLAANDDSIITSEEFIQKAADSFVKQYDKADVNIIIEEFEYTKEEEAVPQSFDTDNAVDVLYEGYFNMSTYIHTGRVVPLDDIISDELRSDIDDSIWEMSMVDGKTYMMPFLSLQNILAYNRKLFNQCGLEKYVNEDLEAIDSWTLEEWEDILDTLAEKLPQNIYPMMMYAKNDQGDTHIMTYIRSHGSKFFNDDNNFNINTPEGIEALQWLLDGKEKNWFPPYCENLEIADNSELFSNEQLAIMMTNNASFVKLDKSKFGCVNFPSIDGKGYATSFVTGFEVFDNGDADKLEASKAFVQYVCENDQWADYSTGGLPARNSIADKYKDDIYMLSSCMENNSNVVDFTHNNPNWRGVRDIFYVEINNLFTGRKTPAEVAESIDIKCNEAIEKGRKNNILHE